MGRGDSVRVFITGVVLGGLSLLTAGLVLIWRGAWQLENLS